MISLTNDDKEMIYEKVISENNLQKSDTLKKIVYDCCEYAQIEIILENENK